LGREGSCNVKERGEESEWRLTGEKKSGYRDERRREMKRGGENRNREKEKGWLIYNDAFILLFKPSVRFNRESGNALHHLTRPINNK
jgi:hypothetical protein